MSKWLKKLPGYQVYEPGLERKILRALPQFIFFGILAIGMPSLLARFLLSTQAQKIIDILVIGTEIFYISMIITLGIGAFIVMLSKGPAYVADAYPLIDSDKPAK
jgi:hypothetical protein